MITRAEATARAAAPGVRADGFVRSRPDLAVELMTVVGSDGTETVVPVYGSAAELLLLRIAQLRE